MFLNILKYEIVSDVAFIAIAIPLNPLKLIESILEALGIESNFI
jgi:hypothetical protein